MDEKDLKLIEEAINTRNAKMIYTVANFLEIDDADTIRKMATALVLIGDAEYITLFACDFKEAPVDLLANGVIAAKEPYYIYDFANTVKNAPIDKLADAIIKYGSARFIYNFAFITDAPIDKLAKAIIKTGNETFIESFAYDINHSSVEKFIEKYSDESSSEDEEELQ